MQEVVGSNPASPTKFLIDLQTRGLPDPGLWSPTGVQNLFSLAPGGRSPQSFLAITSWLSPTSRFPPKSTSVFPSALFCWRNPTFPTNRFQLVGSAGSTRVGSVHFPVIEPDKCPLETRQNTSVKRRATDMPLRRGLLLTTGAGLICSQNRRCDRYSSVGNHAQRRLGFSASTSQARSGASDSQTTV